MEFQQVSHSHQNDIQNSRCSLLQDIGTSIHYATETNINELLQLLITTGDIEIQLKVFTLFTMYLLSGHSRYRAAIITFPSIYDEIHNVLIKGYPAKTATTLNFVSSLLYESDEEDSTTAGQSLTLYARNMIRVSGCLSVISRLFCGTAMHQDIWRPLCHCLAEVCRNSEDNKNHSSNLIPKAVQKCLSGDEESASVLLCLLNHHERNAQLFVDCGGLWIFNRERLQINAYLQLLDTVVQNRKLIVMLIHRTEIVKILKKFLHSYEVDSQITRWATVILYHIKLHVHALAKVRENARISENMSSCNGITLLYSILNKTDSNDTRTLLQNVEEVLKYEQPSIYNESLNMGKRTRNGSLFHKTKHSPVTLCEKKLNMSSVKCVKSSLDEMSFSFLLNKSVYCNNKTYTVPNWHPRSVHELDGSTNSIILKETKIDGDMTMKNAKTVNRSCISTFNEYEQSVSNFMPKFASTPKRNINRKSLQTSAHMRRYLSKTNYNKQICKEICNNKHLLTKRSKKIEHKSFANKLYNTINDSYTILVKTVKNIFKTLKVDSNVNSRKEESTLVTSSDVNINNNNCSYSFTNYMLKRDAIFGDKPMTTSSLKSVELDPDINCGHSCDTCNNTLVLKYKLRNNNHLRQTIKKLKYGINLYGCNFKVHA